ncbi:hypothetical protein AB0I00_18730 [Streptomyces sp. NPDC050803]|uniref:hypothetical protein n=1 Tax=unclassified Streptomyces TaxID=2593676 RepID=UPI0034405897
MTNQPISLLRRGAGHPLTRVAAAALLQALATHLSQTGSAGTRSPDCSCRVSRT